MSEQVTKAQTANTTAPGPPGPLMSSFPPQVQSARGAVVQITGAQWFPADAFAPTGQPTSAPTPGEAEQWLGLWLEFKTPGGKAASTKDWLALRGRAEGVPSEGTLLPRGRTENKYVMAFRGVDPRSTSLPIEFEWTDPGTNRETNRETTPGETNPGQKTPGNFEELVEVSDLPIPTVPDQVVAINREFQSRQGTKIVVESVTLAAARNSAGHPRIEVVVCWYPPEAMPDLCAILRVVREGAVDDKGTKLYRYQPPIAGMSEWARTGYRQKFLLLNPPAPEAHNFSLKIEVRERVQSLLENARSRFPFLLDLSALPRPTGVHPLMWTIS